MGDIMVGYDPTKPVGQRLGPAVRTEIAEVAPTNIPPGSIGSEELATDAVEAVNIAAGAVDADALKAGAVGTAALANGGVTGAKVQDGTLGPDKMAAGIVTAQDASGNDITMPVVTITSTVYSSLSTPDPNTLYLIF